MTHSNCHFQTIDTFNIRSVALVSFTSGQVSSARLSPAFLYSLANPPKSPCDSEHCAFKASLTTIQRSCSFMMVCSKLDKNICANHGLVIQQQNSQRNVTLSTSICHVGQAVTYKVMPMDFLSIEFWKSSTTNNLDDFSCNFWCTEDGNMPGSLEDHSSMFLNGLDSTALQLAVNDPLYYSSIDFKQESRTFISPMKVYKLSFDDTQTDAYSEWSLRFSNARNYQCQGKIVCPSLKGDVCGNYGFVVGNQTVICVMNVPTRIDLDSEADLTLTAWAFDTRSEKAEAACYLWCSENGQLPTTVENQDSLSFADGLDFAFIKGQEQTLLDWSEMGSRRLGISPINLYSLKLSSQESGLVCQTEEMVCKAKMRMIWYGQQYCETNLVCVDLTGSICGDSGLTVTHKTDETEQNYEICFPNQKLVIKLERFDELQFTGWHVPGSRFNMECYLWCTDRGYRQALGDELTSEEIEGALPENLNNTGSILAPTGIETKEPSVLSPLNDYTIRLSSKDRPICDREVCHVTETLKWMRPTSCELTMVCKDLSGNVCGDYGLTLSVESPKKDISICNSNQQYIADINTGSSITTNLWYSQSSVFNVLCNLWCKDPGLQGQQISTLTSTWLEKLRTHQHESLTLNNSPENSMPFFSSNVKLYNLKTQNSGICSSTICSSSRLIQWLGKATCEANLACPKLNGHACGDFGVQLKKVSKTTELCRADQKASYRMNTNDQIQIEVWHSQNASFDVNCYFWCTSTGNLPPLIQDVPGDKGLSDQLSELEQTSQDFVNLVPYFNDVTVFLSPIKVEHITVNSIPMKSCGDNVCEHSRTLKWQGKGSCTFGFTCPILKGNPCGEYGLSLSYQSEHDQLCFTNTVRKHNIQSGDEMSVQLWYQKDAPSLSFSCYAWCTSSGDIPLNVKQELDFAQESTLQEMKLLLDPSDSKSYNKDILKAFTWNEPMILSPFRMYQIKPNKDESESCKGPVCTSSQTVQIISPRHCQSKTMCTEMSGNSCGTYGLSVTANGQETSLCFKDQVISEPAQPGSVIKINLWQLKEAQLDFTCYIWCTADGSTPLGMKQASLETGDQSTDQMDVDIWKHLNVTDNEDNLADLLGMDSILFDGDVKDDQSLMDGEQVIDLEDIQTIFLSPLEVQDVNLATEAACDDVVCNQYTKLSWMGRNTCELEIDCSQMTGQECEEFGVEIISKGHQTDLCLGTLPLTKLDTKDSIAMKVWFWNEASFEATCQVKCMASSSQLPSEWQSHVLTDQILESLMQNIQPSSTTVIDISLSHSLNLSPVKIYQIRLGSIANNKFVTKDCDGSLCSVTKSVQFMGEGTCNATIACPDMAGNLCAELGVAVTYAGKEAELCNVQNTLQVQLGKSGKITFMLWFLNQNQLSGSCYLWCSESGNVPGPNDEQTALPAQDMDKLSEFDGVNWSPTDQDPGLVEIAGMKAGTLVSPLYVYTLEVSRASSGKCAQSVCNSKYNLDWLGMETCQGKFVCTKLSDNICGDYGLKISVNGLQTNNVCHPNQVVAYQMTTGDEIELNLWQTPQAFFGLKCYMWCTSSGQLPKGSSVGTETLSPSVLQELNGILNDGSMKSSQFSTLDWESKGSVDKPKASGLSPVKIYQLVTDMEETGNAKENEDCTNGVCVFEKEMSWNGKSTCEFNFACTKMTGNPCADFGVIINQKSQNSTKLCFENQLYKATLNEFDSISVTLWANDKATFDYSCNYWCTPSGQLPSLPNSDVTFIDEKLVDKIIAIVTDWSLQEKDDVSETKNAISVSTIEADDTTLLSKLVERMSLKKLYHLLFTDANVAKMTCTDKMCHSTRELQWIGTNLCTFKFTCLELTGNICGDYGIIVSHDDVETSFCYEDQSVNYTMNSSSKVKISLWAVDGASFRSSCFAWCSPTGQVPSIETDFLTDTLKKDLAAEEEQIAKITVDPQNEGTNNNIINWGFRGFNSSKPYHLSPAILYTLAEKSDSVNAKDNCQGLICSSHQKLKWIGEDVCHFNFVCTRMQGNACEDFGLNAVYENQEQNLCFENQLVSLQLDTFDEVSVNMWFLKEADFDITCYAWCTSSGQLPDSAAPSTSFLPGKILDQLRNETDQSTSSTKDGFSHMFDVSWDTEKDSKSPLSMSTTQLYNLSSNIEGQHGPSVCEGGICFSKKTLVWPGKDSCTFLFTCTELPGNVCGDYGLVASHDGVETDICHEGQSVSYPLTSSEEVEITMWSAKGATFKTSCFAWCTDRGYLPSSAKNNIKMMQAEDVIELKQEATKNSDPTNDDHGGYIKILHSNPDSSMSPASYYLAPNKLFEMSNMEALQAQDCVNDICTIDKSLKWIGKNACQFNFVCIKLKGNACGEFGIDVIHKQNKTRLCYKNQVLEFRMQTLDEVHVALWYSKTADFKLTCHAWCTPTGALPVLSADNMADVLSPSMLEDLKQKTEKSGLSDMSQYKSIKWNEDVASSTNPLSLSPIMLYELTVSEDMLEPCTQEKCSSSKVFIWMNKDPSIFVFAITSAIGNLCGEFGIEITHNETSRNICYESQRVSFTLNTFDQIQFTIWWAQDAKFMMTGFVWSTQTGNIPTFNGDMLNSTWSSLLNSENIGDENKNSLGDSGVSSGSNHLVEWSESFDQDQLNFSPIGLYQISKHYTQLKKGNAHNCNVGLCSSKKTLRWLGNGKCHFTFACTVVDGNSCGDFGIMIKRTEEEEPICYRNEVKQGVLNKFDEIQVSIWFSQKASFNSTCFTWCTETGMIPTNSRDLQLLSEDKSRQLIEGLSNQLTDRDEHSNAVEAHFVKVNDSMKNVTLSPTTVYGLMSPLFNRMDEKCSGKICNADKVFKWIGMDSCQFNMVCTKMTGNPCGDYGLMTSYQTMNSSICAENELISHSLDTRDEVTVSIWQAKDVEFDASCYIWCTPSGSIPFALYYNVTALPDSTLELLNMMESNSGQITTKKEQINWSNHDSMSSMYLSPIKLYDISKVGEFLHKDSSQCENGICMSTKAMKWAGPGTCNFKFACTNVVGNICGEFGVTVSTLMTKADICFKGQVFESSLNRFDEVKVSLWYNMGKDFKLNCNAWCTTTGQLPSQESQNAQFLSDDISKLLNVQPVQDFIRLSFDQDSPAGLSPVKIYDLSFSSQDMETMKSMGMCADGICMAKKQFVLAGQEACEFNFACTSLQGNPCAEFGMIVGPDQQVDMCFTNQLYKTSLKRNDMMVLQMWSLEKAIFESTCYAWCTPTGQLPHWANDAIELIDDDLSKQLKTFDESFPEMTSLLVIGDTSGPSTTALSLKKMYQWHYSDSDVDNMNCHGQMCSSMEYLQWIGVGSCTLTFTCTELTENICGDYGVTVTLDDKEISICHDGQYVSYPLESLDKLRLNYWAVSGAKFKASCFSWCTPTGSLPSSTNGLSFLNETMTSLLTDEATVSQQQSKIGIKDAQSSEMLDENEIITWEFRGNQASKPVHMSPTKLYEFSKHASKAQDSMHCDDKVCSSTKVFKWIGEEVCQFNFACINLQGSTCETFGVLVSFNDNKTNMCFKNQVYKQTVDTFDEISVTLWSSNKALFDADCFLWCTSSGNLPQNSAEMAHFLPNELLKQLLADTAESRARLDGAAKSTYITDIGWNLNDDHSPVMMSMTKLYNISIWNGKIKTKQL